MPDFAILIGKTVALVEPDFDEPREDDVLTIHFTDGTRLFVRGCWCNDGTGALSCDVATPVATPQTAPRSPGVASTRPGQSR